MKDTTENNPILLKSVHHLKLMDTRGSVIRSLLIALQYTIVLLPNEILKVIIIPTLVDFLRNIYETTHALYSLIVSYVTILYLGIQGRLEVADTDDLKNDDHLTD